MGSCHGDWCGWELNWTNIFLGQLRIWINVYTKREILKMLEYISTKLLQKLEVELKYLLQLNILN